MPHSLPQYYFNTPHFIDSREHPPVHIFHSGNYFFASFYQVEGVFLSNYRATFGGFEISETCTKQDLLAGIEQVKASAKEAHCHSIQLSLWPQCYNENTYNLQVNALIQSGFTQLYIDTNFHIPVTVSPFESHLHSMEHRKLKKSIASQLHFQQENNPSNLSEYYQLFEENRAHKGYPVSVSKEQLRSMLPMPNEYPFFTVRSKLGELVACCLCIRISDTILYTFMPADRISSRHLSPNVIQHQGIYNFCLENHIHILDLGTCGAKGIPNDGVAQFKTNIGALKSRKQTFILKL